MVLIIRSVKICVLGPPRPDSEPSWAPIPNKPTVSVDIKQHSMLHPLSPSVPAEAGCHLVSAAAWAPMCLIQGRAYTVSWLV